MSKPAKSSSVTGVKLSNGNLYIGLDWGTHGIGFAYSFSNSEAPKIFTDWPCKPRDLHYSKDRTVALVVGNDVKEIGWRAERVYSQMPDKDRSNARLVYGREMKLRLLKLDEPDSTDGSPFPSGSSPCSSSAFARRSSGRRLFGEDSEEEGESNLDKASLSKARMRRRGIRFKTIDDDEDNDSGNEKERRKSRHDDEQRKVDETREGNSSEELGRARRKRGEENNSDLSDKALEDIIVKYFIKLRHVIQEKIQNAPMSSNSSRLQGCESGRMRGGANTMKAHWTISMPVLKPSEQEAFRQKLRKICARARFVENEHSNRLEVVLEPEAASLACYQNLRHLSSYGDVMMVVDAGAGTTDVSVMKIEQRKDPNSNPSSSTYKSTETGARSSDPIRLSRSDLDSRMDLEKDIDWELKGIEDVVAGGTKAGSTDIDKRFMDFFRSEVGPEAYDEWRKDNPGEALKFISDWEMVKCNFKPSDELIKDWMEKWHANIERRRKERTRRNHEIGSKTVKASSKDANQASSKQSTKTKIGGRHTSTRGQHLDKENDGHDDDDDDDDDNDDGDERNNSSKTGGKNSEKKKIQSMFDRLNLSSKEKEFKCATEDQDRRKQRLGATRNRSETMRKERESERGAKEWNDSAESGEEDDEQEAAEEREEIETEGEDEDDFEQILEEGRGMEGSKGVIFIDMPRSLKPDDNYLALLKVNGLLKSDGRTLQISHYRMLHKFFAPSLKHIIRLIGNKMKEIARTNKQCSKVVLVGGFANANALQETIYTVLSKHDSSFQKSYVSSSESRDRSETASFFRNMSDATSAFHEPSSETRNPLLFIPKPGTAAEISPDEAVTVGNTLLAQYPGFIQARTSSMTYGVRINTEYEKGMGGKFWDKQSSGYMSRCGLDILIPSGKTVDIGESIPRTYAPVDARSKYVKVEIFGTEEKLIPGNAIYSIAVKKGKGRRRSRWWRERRRRNGASSGSKDNDDEEEEEDEDKDEEDEDKSDEDSDKQASSEDEEMEEVNPYFTVRKVVMEKKAELLVRINGKKKRERLAQENSKCNKNKSSEDEMKKASSRDSCSDDESVSCAPIEDEANDFIISDRSDFESESEDEPDADEDMENEGYKGSSSFGSSYYGKKRSSTFRSTNKEQHKYPNKILKEGSGHEGICRFNSEEIKVDFFMGTSQMKVSAYGSETRLKKSVRLEFLSLLADRREI